MRFGFTAPLERRTGCDVSTTYQALNVPGNIGQVAGSSSSGGSIESPVTVYFIRRTGEGAFRNVPADKLTLREYVP